MSDPSIYGKVGHKLAKASSAAVLGNTVDTEAKHGVRETVLFQDGVDLYHAIYVYAGQTISGSAFVKIAAAGTASVTLSGYIALMSAGLAALPGEHIWVRSSALSGYNAGS
jgi:hypothetical protein